jgi:geranylgeranyl pyrophosphate synthase
LDILYSDILYPDTRERAQYDQAREILMIMGQYFQVQDDFLDCYGAPEVRAVKDMCILYTHIIY